MAKTGREEYDELPSVVGATDVDAARAEYAWLEDKIEDLTEKRNKVEATLEGIVLTVNPKPKKAKIYGDPMVIMD